MVLLLVVAFLPVKQAYAFKDVGKMSDREIQQQAQSMGIKELKVWADSIYFPADQKAETRKKAEIVYKEMLHRAMAPMSVEEEKTMARGYSNYATFLIFDKNDPVQAYPLLRQSPRRLCWWK